MNIELNKIECLEIKFEYVYDNSRDPYLELCSSFISEDDIECTINDFPKATSLITYDKETIETFVNKYHNNKKFAKYYIIRMYFYAWCNDGSYYDQVYNNETNEFEIVHFQKRRELPEIKPIY